MGRCLTVIYSRHRNVAQSGRAPRWGRGGREIEARRSDHFIAE